MSGVKGQPCTSFSVFILTSTEVEGSGTPSNCSKSGAVESRQIWDQHLVLISSRFIPDPKAAGVRQWAVKKMNGILSDLTSERTNNIYHHCSQWLHNHQGTVRQQNCWPTRFSETTHTHNTQMNNQRRIFWGNRSDKGHECWPQCSETSPVVSDALWQFGFQWNAAGGARTWIIIGLLLSLLQYLYQWFSSCTSYALDPVMSASIWAPPTAACRFSHCWLLLESIQTGESDTEKQSFKKTHTHALY